jgi:hypothetical protein
MTLRTLFGAFKTGNINYTIADFDNYGSGSFTAILKERYNNAAIYRPEFARRPNRAHFDHSEDYKIRNNANPEFQIHNNWDDLMLVYYFVVAKLFCMRAAKEVSFLRALSKQIFDIFNLF